MVHRKEGLTLFVKRNQQLIPKKGSMRAGIGTVNRNLPDILWGGGSGMAQADMWHVGSMIVGENLETVRNYQVYYEREVVAGN